MWAISPAPETFEPEGHEPGSANPNDKNIRLGLVVWLVGNDKRVLEVGTSAGHVTRILKQNGNRVTGIEIDGNAAEIARQFCERMVIGDVESVDLGAHLKENDYDVIVLGDVLEYLKDPPAVLKKLKKYMKTGGYAVVSLPNVCHGDLLLNLMQGDFKNTPMGVLDATHIRFYDLKKLIELFGRCGYAIDCMNKITVPFGYKELLAEPEKVPQDLLAYLRSLLDSDIYWYVFKLVPATAPPITARQEVSIKPLFKNMVDSAVKRYMESIERENAELSADHRKALEKISMLETEISAIKHGIVWRLITGFHNGFIERLMPRETRRRNAYNLVLGLGRVLADAVMGPRVKAAENKNEAPNAEPRFPRVVSNRALPHWRGRTPERTPRVSLIIVTYNSQKTIGDAIESVVSQGYPPGALELVIVDNGSKDETSGVVKKCIGEYGDKLPIRFIDTGKNNGFARGVNLGVRNASKDAEYVLLVNPDCKLYGDTIKELVSAASATEEHGFRLWECRQMPYEHPKHYSPVTLETSWSSGACCLIQKKAFERLGGFDENIFLYMEDVDLSWRMRMGGHKLMYVPHARVWHDTYAEAHAVKSALYYRVILYQFYLRYKYGSPEEIRWYYREYFRLLKMKPNHLPHEGLWLAVQFVKHLALVPEALAFRIRNRKALGAFKPLFMGFDFEYQREGAFVRSGIDPDRKEPLPKVSIVVRTIGRKGFLREALTSIRNQTYGDIEAVVVEDGPATVKGMLEGEFAGMDLKYAALGARHGPIKVGNVGLGMCSGKYIRFLDDDDLLYPTSVETAMYFILQGEGRHKAVYDLSYEVPTEVISAEPLQYREYDYRLTYNHDFNREALVLYNYMPIQDVLFDRELLERYGGFDEGLHTLEDWDLWIRYSQHTDFLKIPKVESLYRVPAAKKDMEKRQARLNMYYGEVREKHSDLVDKYAGKVVVRHG